MALYVLPGLDVVFEDWECTLKDMMGEVSWNGVTPIGLGDWLLDGAGRSPARAFNSLHYQESFTRTIEGRVAT